MLEIKFMKQELFSKKGQKHSKIKIYIYSSPKLSKFNARNKIHETGTFLQEIPKIIRKSKFAYIPV